MRKKIDLQKELRGTMDRAAGRQKLIQSEIALHYDWILKNLSEGRDEVAIAMHLINVRKCKAIGVSDIRNLKINSKKL